MFYIDGAYVADEKATISVLDLGLLRGYAVFDYLRTYNGKPFHLHEHLLRLERSAREVALSLPHTLEEIAAIILHLLQINGYEESSIKVILTGGISPDQLLPQDNPSLIILVYPLKLFARSCYEEGIHAVTIPLERSLPLSKTTQYLPAALALQKARSQGAQEILYTTPKREILEAATSNFFGFKNGVLLSCFSEDVLPGITREVILKLAAPYFPIEVRLIRSEELPYLEEAFVSSSNKEIMPVVQIDGKKIGKGEVGPHTQLLMELFASYTKQPFWEPLMSSQYASVCT